MLCIGFHSVIYSRCFTSRKIRENYVLAKMESLTVDYALITEFYTPVDTLSSALVAFDKQVVIDFFFVFISEKLSDP